jgi:peptide/nickel transport system permease protein
MALVVGAVIAMPIGVYSAIRQDTPGDYVARSFSILMLAVPSFWLGTMVMVFPSIWWGWSPRGPVRALRQGSVAILSR